MDDSQKADHIEMFDLVYRAQAGDKNAINDIIAAVQPVIVSARYKTKQDRQDDLEQSIAELLIKKIMAYDLAGTPDFSSFCRRLGEVPSPVNLS